MASVFATSFTKKNHKPFLFLLFPGLSNDAFKTASRHPGTALVWATTPAARILRYGQRIQHPTKWLQGCRRLWDAPPPTAQTDKELLMQGSVHSDRSVLSKSNEERYPNSCKKGKLYNTQKKILLSVSYRKFTVRGSWYPNDSFTELTDSWAHWFPQG